MALSRGGRITTDGLRVIYDSKNYNSYYDNTLNGIHRSEPLRDGETDSTSISASIYDSTNKRFVLNGIDEDFEINKNINTGFQWPMTLSILCKPVTGSYILNDTDSLILYYTKNKKISLQAGPSNRNWAGGSGIGIDENNNTLIMFNRDSFNAGLLYLNESGEIIGARKDSCSNYWTYAYSYGKIHFKDGLDYVQTYDGWTECTDFLTATGDTNYKDSTRFHIHVGDMDIDDDYVYLTAEYYTERAFKIEKADRTNVISFGSGAVGSDTGSLSNPRGIAVGTNYVFVADKDNHRIMVLNKGDMTYYTHLGITGVHGNTTGSFYTPYGCDVDDGKLYIADRNNNKIKIYNEITLEFINSASVTLPEVISAKNYIAVLCSNGTKLTTFATSSLEEIFSKEFITGTTGYIYEYAAKGMRKSGSIVFAYDRSSRLRELYTNPLSYQSGYTGAGGGDANDIAFDDDYMYTVYHSPDYVKKINKTTWSTVASITTVGSGDGEINNPYGVAVDDDYVYVADSGNYRVQVLNKSDLSYYTKFGSQGTGDEQFNTVYSVEIDDGKVYVGDSSNKKVKIYDQTTLTQLAIIPTSTNPNKVRIDGDDLYIQYGRTFQVYDKTTGDLKKSKSFSSIRYVGGMDSSTNFAVLDDKIFVQQSNAISILDKETLEVEALWSVWYKTALVDEVIPEEAILIDIVFTDDYKIKVFVNGRVSNEIEFTSNYSFESITNNIYGSLRNNYSEIEYEWIAYYNKALSYNEHLQNYNALKTRFQR